jgi:hypothetical protein
LAFDGAAQNEKANPAAAENASAFKTQKERQSYALGSTVGSQLRNRSVEVDPDVFMQGLKDTLSGGQTLLTGEEVRAEVRDLQLDLRKKEIALRGEKLQEVQKNKQERDATPVAATLNDIKIAFKDPRLSDPTYGGQRWISTPTFTSALQGGTEATVEAKAVGIGANGRRTEASAKWTPADPETVTVTPGSRNVVKITVHRAGDSKLTVASNGVSKELLIKAKYVGNATLVEITQ